MHNKILKSIDHYIINMHLTFEDALGTVQLQKLEELE